VQASSGLKEDVNLRDWNKEYDENGVQSGGERNQTFEVWLPTDGEDFLYTQRLSHYELRAGGEDLKFSRSAVWAAVGLAVLRYWPRSDNDNGSNLILIRLWYSFGGLKSVQVDNGTAWDIPMNNNTALADLMTRYEEGVRREEGYLGIGRRFSVLDGLSVETSATTSLSVESSLDSR